MLFNTPPWSSVLSSLRRLGLRAGLHADDLEPQAAYAVEDAVEVRAVDNYR